MNAYILPLVMLLMVGWMFYSQRKQQKAQQEKMSKIKKADEIVTIGGLYGIVDEIDDKKVVLDIDGVYLTFARFAIREITKPAASATSVETTSDSAIMDSAVDTE